VKAGYVGDTLSLTARVLPENAENKTVTWSVVSGGDCAVITQDGLLTAQKVGTVKVRATANDGSGVYGEWTVTVKPIPVSSVTISGGNQVYVGEKLQLSASVLPENATNKQITWSIVSGGDCAVITQDGLLTAQKVGTVKVRATANDGSGVYGEWTVTVKPIPVSSITISGGNQVYVGEKLQLSASVLPENAENKTVTWSVVSGGDCAVITQDGLLTAQKVGTVKVRVTANDGSGVYGEWTVTVKPIPVSSITISGGNQVYVGEKLQLSASVLPENATNKQITWSISSGRTYASISSGGELTAIAKGTVTVKASAGDGSGVTATFQITVKEKSLWDGSGTQADPFLIRNLTDLKNLEKVLDKAGYYFRQVADIDASEMEAWIVLGDEEKPFAHHYDGGNYQIRNLHFNNDSNSTDSPAGGLFTYAKNATFRNINIVNATTSQNHQTRPNNTGIYAGAGPATGAIVGSGVNCAFYHCTASVDFRSSNMWTGGIIGIITLSQDQTVLMEDCHVTGFISGANGTGGLVGVIGKYLLDAEWASVGEPVAVVKNCTVAAEISISVATGIEYGTGGLIGTANHVRVEHCSATGKVTGYAGHIGGLIGDAEYDCRIAYCYATGDVICTSDDAYGGGFTGGLLGYMLSYTTVHDCYATGNVYAEKLGWSSCQDSSSYSGGPWLNYRNPCGSLIGCVKNFNDIVIYNNYATGYVYAPKICEDKVYCHTALVGCVYDDYTRRRIINTNQTDQTDWSGFSEVYTEYFKDNYNLEPLRTYYTPINYFERKAGYPAKYIMPQHEFVTIVTQEQLKDQATFAGWDFRNIWEMTENGPVLRQN